MRPQESSRSGYVSIHITYMSKMPTPQTRFCPHGDSTSVPTGPFGPHKISYMQKFWAYSVRTEILHTSFFRGHSVRIEIVRLLEFAMVLARAT
jgi:hypothetical protein